MNFLGTFAAILLIVVGIAWFAGDSNITFDSSSVFESRLQDEQIESIRNHPVNQNVSVTISNINGSITITGHEHHNAVIKITKKGNKDNFKDVQAQVNVTKNTLSIKTNYKERFSHQNVSVHYDLKLPSKAALELIESVNGKIMITDISQSINAKTVNGGIKVYNSESSVTLYTANGSILYSPETLAKGKNVTIQTTNGSIVCKLPKNFSAHVSAVTSVGSINSDFPLPDLQKEFVGQKAKGIIGNNPQGMLKLVTTSGFIKLEKK